MSSKVNADDWMNKVQWPTDSLCHLLLPRGARYVTHQRGGKQVKSAFGAGLINLISTSGGGKTTLALALLQWVTIHSPVARPLCFMGHPEKWLSCLPDDMREVSYVLKNLDELHLVKKGSILLLDDTGIHTPARRAMASTNVKLSKFAQIARHLDITIMMTAQSHRVIDFAAGAVAETVDIIKWYSLSSLQSERNEKKGAIQLAQTILRDQCGNSAEECLPFYWCVQDRKLGTYPCPKWLLDDRVGRPFGEYTQEEMAKVLE